MYSSPAFCNFLIHFDGIHSQTARGAQAGMPARGVGWILRWAMVFAVLWFAASVLAQFAYSLAAEHTLARAARAGVLEATLPRATYQTVRDTVKRRLTEGASWAEQSKLTVHRNGLSVGGAFRTVGGDRMAVALAVPSRSVVPRWLNAFSFWTSDSQIEVRAERQVPGRTLAGVGSL